MMITIRRINRSLLAVGVAATILATLSQTGCARGSASHWALNAPPVPPTPGTAEVVNLGAVGTRTTGSQSGPVSPCAVP